MSNPATPIQLLDDERETLKPRLCVGTDPQFTEKPIAVQEKSKRNFYMA